MGEKKTVTVSRLEELRTLQGITVDELAEMSGVGRSSIYAYEQGRKRISITASWKILNALGIDEFINLNELVEADARCYRPRKRRLGI